MHFRKTAILVFLLGCSSVSATAATLIIDAGTAIGVAGLEIDGQLYNGTFGDGTCIGLFDGCDENSDFVSNDGPGMFDLMAQLRLAIEVAGFDDAPASFLGCGPSTGCSIMTPLTTTFALIQFIDTTPPLGSPFGATPLPADRDTATGFNHERVTYMTLAPVPLPAAAWFLMSALIGLFGLQKRV